MANKSGVKKTKVPQGRISNASTLECYEYVPHTPRHLRVSRDIIEASVRGLHGDDRNTLKDRRPGKIFTE